MQDFTSITMVFSSVLQMTRDRSSVFYQSGHFSRCPKHLLCARLNGALGRDSQMKLAKHLSSNSLRAGVRGKISTVVRNTSRQGWYLRNSRVSVPWKLLEGDNSFDGSGKGKSGKAPWNKWHFKLSRASCI